MKKIKMLVAIFFLVHFFIKLYAQNINVRKIERLGDEYLKKTRKKIPDFSSEDEKNSYLVRHLHDMEAYYNFATEISKYKNKSPELLEALQEKVLQCLLHYEVENDRPFRGILTAIFENSPDLKREYVPLLEALARGDSKFQTEKYLKSIALKPITHSSALFSLSDKMRILANKRLLILQPDHAAATQFFLNYPVKRSTEKPVHYFVAADNNWSGYGIVDEHGAWILLPFYQFAGAANRFSEGMATVTLVSGSTPSGYLALSNWIDTEGRFVSPVFVNMAGRFIAGKARCEVAGKTKYINRNGTFWDIQNPENLFYLENGYAYQLAEDKVHLIDDQGKILRTLDKTFRHIVYHPNEQLIAYISRNSGDGRFGYLDMQGNILTEPVYHTSIDYSYDSGSFNGHDIMVLRYEYQQEGLVNKQFKTLIPFQYDRISIINQKYVVAQKRDQYTLFYHTGEIVQKDTPEWFKMDWFTVYDGAVGISEKNGISRVLNEDGALVKGLEDFHAGASKHGFISLKKEKWGVLDHQFNPVLPFIYDEVVLVSNEIIVTRLDDLFQSHHLSDKKTYDFPRGLTSKEYGPECNKEFIILLDKNGKAGALNLKGEVILPFVFHHLLPGWPMG